MKFNFKILGVSIFAIFMLIGCGKKNFNKLSFKDGTYIGKASEEDSAAYTEVKITIKDNKIIACDAEFRDSKQNIKDENYGKNAGEKKYAQAQLAVQGMKKYPEMLLEVQDPDEVDSISGATVTNKQFREAVWKALDKAEL